MYRLLTTYFPKLIKKLSHFRVQVRSREYIFYTLILVGKNIFYLYSLTSLHSCPICVVYRNGLEVLSWKHYFRMTQACRYDWAC